MDEKTHAEAQRIVTRLCVGRTVTAVGVVAEPVLTLGAYLAAGYPGIPGPPEAYLHIEAGSHTSGPNVPAEPSSAAMSLAELAGVVVSLRGLPVTEASLGFPSPHLTLRFANGTALHIEGHDPTHEPWRIAAGDWSIYALANDDVTWGVPHPALVRGVA